MTVDLHPAEAASVRIDSLEQEIAQLRQQLFDAGDGEVVEAPAEMAPLFREAEARVRSFFRDFHADPARAEIDVHGQRYVLLRGAALSVEFFQMVRRLFRADDHAEADRFSARLLYDLAHVTGRNDCDELSEKMELTDPIARLSAGPVHFAYTGWANVRLHEHSCAEPGDDFCLSYEHPQSFEAEAWIRAGVPSEQPVCVMNAGYSSGWCESAFGIPLEAVEVSCRARGDDACRFVMAPPHRIAEQVGNARRSLDGPPLHPLTGGAPDFLARRDIEDAHRRGEDGARGRVQAERRLLAYAHALEATRELLRRKVEELEHEVEQHRSSQRRLERTQHTLDEIATAILWVDLSMQVTYANHAACELLDIPREELLGKSIPEIDRHQSREQLEQLFDDLREHKTVVAQSWHQNSRGRHFPIEIHASLQRSEHGDVVFCFIEEISERLAEEQRRNEARVRAENQAREKAELLATLSHEIRTPLTAVVSMIDLLRDAPLDETLKDFVATAGDASDHILRLIERTLDFSRLESGRAAADVQECEPRRLVDRVVRMVQRQTDGRPVALVVELDEHLPERIEIDASALQQVLLNLVTNALKATDEGTVTVRARGLGQDEAQIALHFEIEDTGRGIAPEDQPHLFEPFTRVGARSRSERGGMGLGLAISARLCAQMGGDIGMRSEPGQGTCFWFSVIGHRLEPTA